MTTPKRKRFKTCLGCPFMWRSSCQLVRVRPDDLPGAVWLVGKTIGTGLTTGTRPPAWCPLRKRPVLVELDVS